ncbi:MAG TPA: LPS assembly lipoprotein LptE [Chitinophagaceae bacterium]|nr:LPS assembly lipoprotein LptE [Chitinophagaceae bacterium]
MNFLTRHKTTMFVPCALLVVPLLLAACGIYSFRDVSIEPEAKTVRVAYLENRARYVNPQLSPQLTDKLRQKINNQTRLTNIQSEDAHYDISGYVSDYTVTTSGISNQQAATNRLTVTIHVVFQNRVRPERSFEADVSRNFDFSASLSLNQAEAQLGETIVRNMVDEIFNRIFSNW